MGELMALIASLDELRASGAGGELWQEQGGVPPAPPVERVVTAPAEIGHYRIVEKLAAGGMGVVYRARHTATGQEVALKTVRVVASGLLGSLGAGAAARGPHRARRKKREAVEA